MIISKEFEFDAAHYLTHVNEKHPCSKMHGHTWRVVVELKGHIEPNGFVLDFRELSAIVKPLIEQLDHSTLNEHDGLSNPTSEHLAAWFWLRLASKLDRLNAIDIWESPRSKCRLERALNNEIPDR